MVMSLLSASYAMAQTDMLFSQVVNRNGNPNIRSILRLDDGRMAFATLDGVELFNGSDFSSKAAVTGNAIRLSDYDGFHHLYLTGGGRFLWIKNNHELKCLDLDRELFATDMNALLAENRLPDGFNDFFGDSEGRIWVTRQDTLLQPDLGIRIPLDSGIDRPIDLATIDNRLYLFFKGGNLKAFHLPSGKFLYSSHAYPESEDWKFGTTSLVVAAGKELYQIKNGAIGGLFLFDTEKRQWKRILESALRLNTLEVTDSSAFISTNNGLLAISIPSGDIRHIPMVRTHTGSLLASEISAIHADPDNGLWLGTLNRGIFYHHPDAYRCLEISKKGQTSYLPAHLSSAFSENHDGSVSISEPGNHMTVSIPGGTVSPLHTSEESGLTGEYGSGASFISSAGAVFFNENDRYLVFIPNDSIRQTTSTIPVISEILVNGESIRPLCSYNGNTILEKAAAKTPAITLTPDQNFLTIVAAMPRYETSSAKFDFILEGIDREWHTSDGDGHFGKRLPAYYTALPPGEYMFKVKESGADEEMSASLSVRVLPHWWQTGWAFSAYVLIFITVVATAMAIYARHTKNKIAREQREKFLLTRIRNLIEEVDRYKVESNDKRQVPGTSDDSPDPISDGNQLSDADKAFIARAVEAVEKNLNTPGYSVASLSHDLCMDRTGLYRKLTALLDRSPSLFIRDIRLRYAARLLEEGKLSITEISELTGFSSTSYMSKCFQERYGCRPSDYAEKNKGDM